MDLQFTAVNQTVPEGYIGFVPPSKRREPTSGRL